MFKKQPLPKVDHWDHIKLHYESIEALFQFVAELQRKVADLETRKPAPVQPQTAKQVRKRGPHSRKAVNTGKVWSKGDDKLLLDLQAQGLKAREIARAMGRSARAVEGRLSRIRLGQI